MGMIIMTLKSDLCAGSGTGYSNFVDTDVCYDRYGFPYVPGRRLKGCLREAAEYLGESPDTVSRLFGEPGMPDAGILKIGNGCLMDYRDMTAWIERQEKKPAEVLALFTHVRARTSIEKETGVAKDNSLRYTRVVKHRLPDNDNSETQFVFSCDCPSDDGKWLERVCGALRNIGTNRTRGLGAVKCEYLEMQDVQPISAEKSGISASGFLRRNAEADYTMKVCFRLDEPLYLPSTDGSACRTFVNGSSLLGALAFLYLMNNAGKAGEEFDRLFLSGEVLYPNLYIADSPSDECFPAPYFIRKLKSSDKKLDGRTVTVFDSLKEIVKAAHPEFTDDAVEDTAALVQTKPLRGVYTNKNLTEHKAVVETLYHHPVYNANREREGGLYTQTCLAAGQYLTGTLQGPHESLEKLKKLMTEGGVRLGRSRSAQYSGCTLIGVSDIVPFSSVDVTVPEGSRMVLAMESDYIPLSQTDPIGSLIAEAFPDGAYTERVDVLADYRMIHGYHGKRNLRNTPVRAAAAGSIIILQAKRNLQIPQHFCAGGRISEGFGQICVYTDLELSSAGFHSSPLSGVPTANCDEDRISWFTQALQATEDRSIAVNEGFRLYSDRKTQFNSNDMTKALIGRLILMTEEADSYDDMVGRINSIKDDGKKKTCISIFRAVKDSKYWKDTWLTALRLARYGKAERK